MTNPGWAFAMRGSGETLEIDIYDDIGESYWGDTVSAKDIKAALKSSPNASNIKLRVNSRGGDVFDGFAIYALIQAHPAKVEAHVDGVAASMASIVIMAADTIHVAAGAMIMIHNPWAYAMGEADDLRQTADLLDTLQGTSADIYVARTGIARDEVLAMMDAETWLTAEEAKAKGFADVVTPAKKSAQTKALSHIDLSGLKAPKGLIAACAQARMSAPNFREGTEPEQEQTSMKEEQRIALCLALGVAADASPEAMAQRAMAVVASAGKAPEGFELAVKGELAAAQARAVAAETELVASRKSSRETAVKATLDEAVKSGKIVPASRDKYEARCASDAGFEIVKEILAEMPTSPLLGVQGSSKTPKLSEASALTEEDRYIAKALGKSEAEMLAYKQAEITNGGAA